MLCSVITNKMFLFINTHFGKKFLEDNVFLEVQFDLCAYCALNSEDFSSCIGKVKLVFFWDE